MDRHPDRDLERHEPGNHRGGHADNMSHDRRVNEQRGEAEHNEEDRDDARQTASDESKNAVGEPYDCR